MQLLANLGITSSFIKEHHAQLILYLRAANLLNAAEQWSRIQLLCLAAVSPLLSDRTEPESLGMVAERIKNMEIYGQEAFHILLCVVLYYFLEVLECDREDLACLRKALAEHEWLLDRSIADKLGFKI